MALEASLAAAPEDRTVTFTFRVVNGNTEPVELTFTSGRVGDLVVYASASPPDSASASGAAPASPDDATEAHTDPVWQWSAGRAFTQAIRTERLGPGETLEQTFTWTGADPGRYEAVATLAADREVRATTTFAV